MPGPSRGPSLLRDVGTIAGLYLDIFRLMEKRATGHSLIVTYTPPEEIPETLRREAAVPERKREAAHAAR